MCPQWIVETLARMFAHRAHVLRGRKELVRAAKFEAMAEMFRELV